MKTSNKQGVHTAHACLHSGLLEWTRLFTASALVACAASPAPIQAPESVATPAVSTPAATPVAATPPAPINATAPIVQPAATQAALVHADEVKEPVCGRTALCTLGSGTLSLEPLYGKREQEPAPQGPIRETSLHVKGELPKAVVQKILHSNEPRLLRCYEDVLRTKPALHGNIAVVLTVDAEGVVSRSADAGSIPNDSRLVGCVLRSFATLKFPKPKGGPVEIAYGIEYGGIH